MSSNYPDYSAHLENRSSHSSAQPNGVSESDRERNHGWSHRTQIEQVDTDKRKSISQRVNDRRDGETVSIHTKDTGKDGHKASNENDDALVDEKKSIKQRYADRYGDS